MDGYVLTKSIKEKVTHRLFIDDLKKYDRNLQELIESNDLIKPIMKDAGLEWNMKKCASIHIRKGKVLDAGDIKMKDGTVIESLKHEDI